jgi:hypothetical protein
MRFGYHAVIEHYRTWLAGDHYYFEKLNICDSVEPDLLRAFARDYRISRTIPRPLNAPDPIVKLWNGIRETQWSNCTIERAKQCRTFAENNKSERAKGKATPYSAVTKLLWFVKPTGWVMYDSLAAKALGSRNGVLGFYKQLVYSGFKDTESSLEDAISYAELDLYASRIIDKFLWIKGGGGSPCEKRDEAFLDLLHPEMREQVKCLASAAEKILHNWNLAIMPSKA